MFRVYVPIWVYSKQKLSTVNCLGVAHVRLHPTQDNLSKAQALDLEKQMIHFYGKESEESGLLLNIADGGKGPNGCKWSDETKQKISLAKSKPVTATCKITGAVFSFCSARRGAEVLEGSKNSINVAIHNIRALGRSGYSGGYYWKHQ